MSALGWKSRNHHPHAAYYLIPIQAGTLLLPLALLPLSALADAPKDGKQVAGTTAAAAVIAEPKPTAAAPAGAQAQAPAPAQKASATPGNPPRVAFTMPLTGANAALKPDLSTKPTVVATSVLATEEDSVARALRTIKSCKAQFENVRDYTCTFYKRERLSGELGPHHVMTMKARTNPRSIYFKFEDPHKGREAIYVEGRNAGKILAHEVGFTRFLTGTLEIEPTSAQAMEENRHPITDAGIGNLIDTVHRRWSSELNIKESVLSFDPDMMIGPRKCLMIESIHPHRRANFHFHKVRLFIDSELNLPIRFEGYDWPKETDGQADLLEEYSYINLRLNVGLGDVDFDIANRHYCFGRF
jgi:hypothetical protein